MFNFLFGGAGEAPEAPDPWETARSAYSYGNVNTISADGSGVRYGHTNRRGKFRMGAPSGPGQHAAVQQVEAPWQRRMRAMMEPAARKMARQITAQAGALPEAPAAPTLNTAPVQVENTDAIARDVYDHGMSLMGDDFAKAQTDVLANLAARGLPVGSAAFNDAATALQQEQTAATTRLAQEARLAAGAEQDRRFSLATASRDGSNAALGQQYSYGQDARSTAMTELARLFGGSYQPASTTPQGGGSGVDMAGLINQKFQADQAAYQQKQAQSSAMWGSIGNIAGSFLLCDPALKDAVAPVDPASAAEAVQELGVYHFHYLHEIPEHGPVPRHIGPMADEWKRLTGTGDGHTIPTVDAVGVLLAAQKSAFARIEDLEARLDMQAQDLMRLQGTRRAA